MTYRQIAIKGARAGRSFGRLILARFLTQVMIHRNALAALAAVLAFVFSSGSLCASPLDSPLMIDISSNVFESIIPGGTIFHDSKPLFGVTADPLQSSELLHLSDVGVNGSGRSTNISSAFASSLAESDGNGGVGVSQLIFGSPGGSGDGVRQLVAQSLWTHTFLYTADVPGQVTLHLHIPDLQVGLIGVPPRRTGTSVSETAEASAEVDAFIMHPDGSGEKLMFQVGLKEFEKQIPSGKDLLNIAVMSVIDTDGHLVGPVKFNNDDVNPTFSIDPLLVDVLLGNPVHNGDIVSWVYTLTAKGTTHGFERGYDAFLGDPFGVDVIRDNLVETITPADVPEASTCTLMLFGLAGLCAWGRQRRRSVDAGVQR